MAGLLKQHAAHGEIESLIATLPHDLKLLWKESIAYADIDVVQLENQIGFQRLVVAQRRKQPSAALTNIVKVERLTLGVMCQMFIDGVRLPQQVGMFVAQSLDTPVKVRLDRFQVAQQSTRRLGRAYVFRQRALKSSESGSDPRAPG
ncbi:MAG TPA: hypothetical protein VG826_23215 [Pirellulales bacterium]|nr:hypothetical protein [Pirellulales bacterium]